MELSREAFEDLLGAYALDACEPEESDAIERYAEAHPEARPEVERLREVAAGIGAADATRPPFDLRERLLVSAGQRVPPMSAEGVLEKETDRFDSFLSTLEEGDLDVRTVNGLTVRELVQHVEAVDRAFVEAAADSTVVFIGAEQVVGITERDLPGRAGEPFAETVARFRRTRRDLAGLRELPESRRVAGYERDSVLVIRAFETWTHHDDVRRAIGHDGLAVPEPAAMRAMADLAMDSLPIALAVRGSSRPGITARIVLDGPGGGEWMVPCTAGEIPAEPVAVVIRASVVDWCRRFADRIEPGAFASAVEGDAELAGELIAAASAFAGL